VRQAVWQKIAESLQQDIRNGLFDGDGRLPTEVVLAARFSVNRHTVRQAIGHLADLGIVMSHQGRGVFLRDSGLEYRVGSRTRLTDNLMRQGRRPEREDLHTEIIPAPRAVSRALRLAVSAPVQWLSYRTRVEGRLTCLNDHYFAAERFPAIGDNFLRLGSITEALRGEGIEDYLRASTRINARISSSSEAKLLDLNRGRPLLVTWGVDCDLLGRPISVNQARMVADSVTLTVERDE